MSALGTLVGVAASTVLVPLGTELGGPIGTVAGAAAAAEIGANFDTYAPVVNQGFADAITEGGFDPLSGQFIGIPDPPPVNPRLNPISVDAAPPPGQSDYDYWQEYIANYDKLVPDQSWAQPQSQTVGSLDPTLSIGSSSPQASPLAAQTNAAALNLAQSIAAMQPWANEGPAVAHVQPPGALYAVAPDATLAPVSSSLTMNFMP